MHGDDYVGAIKLDAQGNVLMTGVTRGATGAGDIYSSGNDIYTAKYAGSTGTLVWEEVYNGPDERRGRGRVHRIIAARRCGGDGDFKKGIQDFITNQYGLSAITHTVVYATGDPVPRTEADLVIPDTAVFTRFGIPAMDGHYLGRIRWIVEARQRGFQ